MYGLLYIFQIAIIRSSCIKKYSNELAVGIWSSCFFRMVLNWSGLWCHKQVSKTWTSNYIPQNSVGSNYLCMPYIYLLLAPMSSYMQWHESRNTSQYALHRDHYDQSDNLITQPMIARYCKNHDNEKGREISDLKPIWYIPYLCLASMIWHACGAHFEKQNSLIRST